MQILRSRAKKPSLTIAPERITWKVNSNQSGISFFINHFFHKMTGNFEIYDGTVITGNDMNLVNADINFSILVRTLSTGNKRRDKRLLGSAFLHAAKFPVINFKSFCIERHDTKKYMMEGSCLVKGITKIVSFEVVYDGMNKDNLGNRLIFLTATGKFNRHDFGFRSNVILDAVLGKEINIAMKLEFM
jgi:polyisoprenoid-binding protein YceI